MKLALGTVQFGLDYGIANKHGRVPFDEAKAVLQYARSNGIDTLDTAIAYGDSEQRLGEIGVQNWNTVSKLPPIPTDCHNLAQWAMSAVSGSLTRLRIKGLYGLLLHRPLELLGPRGVELYEALDLLKSDGLVQKTGVSVYDPAELTDLCASYHFDLVQAPLSVMDRRMVDSGWLTRLGELGTELHVRSIFLQGLLLMGPGERPKSFDRWSALWERYENWLAGAGLTRLQACVRYALSFPEIGKVVIGVDSVDQLRDIVRASRGPAPQVGDAFQTDEAELLNPARWATAG
ncbi:MAG: aldo/keto reductase [Gemmatimonadota bacterium]|nr:aldo/keto reductase [Gemmatimonadota bacterium]